MDKFHSPNGSKFLIDDSTFKEYYASMKEHASKILREY